MPLLAATRGYFVEFNRSVPLDAPLSGIAFPLTATVHSDDETTIIENVATLGDMAQTARQITQASDVTLEPLALYHPAPASPRTFPRGLITPWLTATLIHAALTGVTSVTLADDVLQAIRASGNDSGVFLDWLNRCAGLEVRSLPLALPSNTHAAVVHPGAGRMAGILAANLSPGVVRISLQGAELKGLSLDSKELAVPAFGISFPG